MSEATVLRTVTVTNSDGVHARAAMAIAQTARRFDCRVTLVKNEHLRADGGDVLQILSMAVHPGEQLQLEAAGPDAEAAAAALEQLFANNFEAVDEARK